MNHPAIPNPIIPGFAPDTQIYREGEDYYAAFSSFEYFPGLPIYHSRDLIHWEIFSHAWHRPEQFDLHDYGCSDALAGTTISKWKGKYVVFTTMTRRRPWSLLRMGYVTADSLSGPFSDPIWIEESHSPLGWIKPRSKRALSTTGSSNSGRLRASAIARSPREATML